MLYKDEVTSFAMEKEWNQMDVWAENYMESKLKKKSWLSILRNISNSSLKMTHNLLHPNMAFHLEFSFDQKRWNEVNLLNDIVQIEPLKIPKNWASYDLLKLAKNHEMTYNVLHS